MACHITDIHIVAGKIIPRIAQKGPFYLAFYVNVRQLYWILHFFRLFCIALDRCIGYTQ